MDIATDTQPTQVSHNRLIENMGTKYVTLYYTIELVVMLESTLCYSP